MNDDNYSDNEPVFVHPMSYKTYNRINNRSSDTEDKTRSLAIRKDRFIARDLSVLLERATEEESYFDCLRVSDLMNEYNSFNDYVNKEPVVNDLAHEVLYIFKKHKKYQNTTHEMIVNRILTVIDKYYVNC